MKPLKAYLVGGAVRDKILGGTPHDLDYVVVGETVASMKARGFKQVGKEFPVFLHPQTGDEYALARTERKSGSGHTGFAVDFNPKITIDADLARRDLTVNSMAVIDGKLVDPYGGKKDAENKMLKHTTEAFKEDPLRVFRVARFAATLKGFDIHADTLRMMRSMKKELQSLPGERVFKEWRKSSKGKNPSMFPTVIAQAQAGEHFFKGIDLAKYSAVLFRSGIKGDDAVAAVGYGQNPQAVASALKRMRSTKTVTAKALVLALHGETLGDPKRHGSEKVVDAMVKTKAFGNNPVGIEAIATAERIRGREKTPLAKLAVKLKNTKNDNPALKGKAVGDRIMELRRQAVEKYVNR